MSWRQSEKRERERERERLHDIIRKKVAVVPPDARATNIRDRICEPQSMYGQSTEQYKYIYRGLYPG